MALVTAEYLEQLPSIYRDVLSAFPQVEPARKTGDGLAYQTLYEVLREQYSMGEVVQACQQMEQGGAVEIRNRIFVHPTNTGEQIIEGLTGKKPDREMVPSFPRPPE